MAITKQDIIEALEKMTLIELNDLVKTVEDHFGVVAAAAVAVSADAKVDAAPSEVNVLITSVGQKRIDVIKAVKEITGLTLMEAKKIVDGTTPILVKEKIKSEEGEKIQSTLVEAGATVELK